MCLTAPACWDTAVARFGDGRGERVGLPLRVRAPSRGKCHRPAAVPRSAVLAYQLWPRLSKAKVRASTVAKR